MSLTFMLVPDHLTPIFIAKNQYSAACTIRAHNTDVSKDKFIEFCEDKGIDGHVALHAHNEWVREIQAK